jgi:hypothetical protein
MMSNMRVIPMIGPREPHLLRERREPRGVAQFSDAGGEDPLFFFERLQALYCAVAFVALIDQFDSDVHDRERGEDRANREPGDQPDRDPPARRVAPDVAADEVPCITQAALLAARVQIQGQRRLRSE